MNRRTQRVESLIRDTLGRLILSKLSDPRIDPARTSIVRVEMTEDLLRAKVYVSVMGTEAEQRTVLRALGHAAGHLQELMMRQISLRHTPILDFELDVRFKKTLKTLEILQEVSRELAEVDSAAEAAESSAEPGGSAATAAGRTAAEGAESKEQTEQDVGL